MKIPSKTVLCVMIDIGDANLQDIDRNGYKCTGKPEPLSGDLAGYWSVRIDEKNRIVFRIADEIIEIIQCGTHYGDH